MSKRDFFETKDREVSLDPLIEMLREGAQKLICQAVECEIQEMLSEYSECRTANGSAAG